MGPANANAVQDRRIDAAIEEACARIAPAWPLDRSIAVNPWWGFVGESLPSAAGRLAALAGARALMPRAWFRERWQAGALQAEHVRRAIAESGIRCSVAELVELLEAPEGSAPRRAVVSDVVDARRDLAHGISCADFVVHAASQFCAAYFDEGQARLGPQRGGGLYPAWRRHAERDFGPALLMGFKRYRAAVRALPENPRSLVERAAQALGIPPAEFAQYFTALLLRLNGWAAWCAYRRWQARLDGADDDAIEHLLALLVAWEWLLYRVAGGADMGPRWRAAMAGWSAADAAAGASRELDWVLQRALEIAYQGPLCRALSRSPGPRAGVVRVQAAFCIDVRSEVLRRALEAVSPEVRTLGFAGFFGLPIEYQPLAAESAQPHLPGLLAPRLRAADVVAAQSITERRIRRLGAAEAWRQLKHGAIGCFPFVEALGPLYAAKLFTDATGSSRPVPHPERAGLTPEEHACRKPRLVAHAGGGELSIAARCDLAEAILRGMSLTHSFAPVVLLAGHASESVNNPHAAALDCGACCGQSGEVNARAATALLNEPAVRAGLAARGIEVPAGTWFVAGLHNTMTDECALFDLDQAPPGHRAALVALQGWLAQAAQRARAERAGRLGLAGEEGAALRSALEARARDWAEVRPEWGLAGNAALIVAPRERTRDLDLEGRAFLHEYRWREDAGFSVLELIMTAPMLVAHWINLQYYASTVDNRRFGSGNKVLHNVVGGRIGVFEGNGGDLRVGLPLQSLHDGARWVHVPLRLSVFIEAPRAAIEGVLGRHERVRELVENEWLHLFQIDGEARTVRAYRDNGWREASTVEAP